MKFKFQKGDIVRFGNNRQYIVVGNIVDEYGVQVKLTRRHWKKTIQTERIHQDFLEKIGCGDLIG